MNTFMLYFHLSVRYASDFIEQAGNIQKELQNVERSSAQCLTCVDSETSEEFQIFMQLKQNELDNVYNLLHRKLNNHYDANSIQFDICLEQLMNIDERLSTIHSIMMTPVNIDFTNHDDDGDSKNNVISLINNHDVITSEIYQLREEAFTLIANFPTSFLLQSSSSSSPSSASRSSSLSPIFTGKIHLYAKLISQLKWKFRQLNDLDFYDRNLQSMNHLLSLSCESPLMSIYIGDNLSYNLNSSLTSRRREFLSRYYILSKEFFDKINYVKFQLDNCITDNISTYPSDSIGIHNNNDSVGDSHSPPYSGVRHAMLALKHCLESRYEQLKKIESSMEKIEFNSILSIGKVLQLVLTSGESKQAINSELSNIYNRIVTNMIYCEREINGIAYLLRRINQLLHEYNFFYNKLVISSSSIWKQFYSEKQLEDYYGMLNTFLLWIDHVKEEFYEITKTEDRDDDDDVNTFVDVYCITQMQICMKPLCESLVINLKHVQIDLFNHLNNLKKLMHLFKQFEVSELYFNNSRHSRSHRRSQSVCTVTRDYNCSSLKTTVRRRCNSLCIDNHPANPISLLHLTYSITDSLMFCRNGNKQKDQNDNSSLDGVHVSTSYSGEQLTSVYRGATSPSLSSSSSSATLCHSGNNQYISDCEDVLGEMIKSTTVSTSTCPMNSLVCKNATRNTDDVGDEINDQTDRHQRFINNFSSFLDEYHGSVMENKTGGNIDEELPLCNTDLNSTSQRLSTVPLYLNRFHENALLHESVTKSYKKILGVVKRCQLGLVKLKSDHEENHHHHHHHHANSNNNESHDADINSPDKEYIPLQAVDHNTLNDTSLHTSPLITQINVILKHLTVYNESLPIENDDEIMFIEQKLTNLWIDFSDLVNEMVNRDWEESSGSDVLPVVIKGILNRNISIVQFTNNTSTTSFDQLITLISEIDSSIKEINEFLLKLSTTEEEEKILSPAVWLTSIKTRELLKIETIYLRILILIFNAAHTSLLLVYDVMLCNSGETEKKKKMMKQERIQTNSCLSSQGGGQEMLLLNQLNYLKYILNQFNVSNEFIRTDQNNNNYYCYSSYHQTLQCITEFLLYKDSSFNLSSLITSLNNFLNQRHTCLLKMTTDEMRNTSNNDNNSSLMMMMNTSISMRNMPVNKSVLDRSPDTTSSCHNLQIFEHLLNTADKIIQMPILTMHELKNRYTEYMELFSCIHWNCCRTSLFLLLGKSNTTAKHFGLGISDDHPVDQGECKRNDQEQCTLDLINHGVDLNHKLMRWYGNAYCLLDQWKRLTDQVDWFNVRIQSLWSRLPEPPISKVPQIKLEEFSNTTPTTTNQVVFLSPIQVSYNILSSINSLDALLIHKNWIENILKSFQGLIPICDTILLEGRRLTFELLHLNKSMNNIEQGEIIVNHIYENFYNNNNNGDIHKIWWNKEFETLWYLIIDWISQLVIEFNRQIIRVQSLNNYMNMLESWITTKVDKLNFSIKHYKRQFKHNSNNLYRLMNAFNEIDKIISELYISKEAAYINRVKCLLSDDIGRKDFHRQQHLFYSHLKESAKSLVHVYDSCISQYEKLLHRHQDGILGHLSHLLSAINEEAYSSSTSGLKVLKLFQNWFQLTSDISHHHHHHNRELHDDAMDEDGEEISYILFYATVGDVCRRLEARMPILSAVYSLEQHCLTKHNTTTKSTDYYSYHHHQRLIQWKNNLGMMKKIHVNLANDLFEYRQLRRCYHQLTIEIQMSANREYSKLEVYTNVEKCFFSKYIVDALLNVKMRNAGAQQNNLNSRLGILINKIEEFNTSTKLTQQNAVQLISLVYGISEGGDISSKLILSNNDDDDEHSRCKMLEVLLHLKDELQQSKTLNGNEYCQLLLSNRKCSATVLSSQMGRFHQLLCQLLHVYGSIIFMIQSAEKFDFSTILSSSNNSQAYFNHTALCYMFNMMYDIEQFKEYWSNSVNHQENNDDDGANQSNHQMYNDVNDLHNEMFSNQSIFNQFINCGRTILNLFKQGEEEKEECFVCEYIQNSVRILLNELTTMRLDVTNKLDELHRRLYNHINYLWRAQIHSTGIMHQLQYSKDRCRQIVMDLINNDDDEVCITSEMTSTTFSESHQDSVPSTLSLFNLARFAYQHSLLSSLKDVNQSNLSEHHKTTNFSLNSEISNFIKLIEICLCRIKHQRIYCLKSIQQLLSSDLYSPILDILSTVSENQRELTNFSFKWINTGNLMNRINHAIEVMIIHTKHNILSNMFNFQLDNIDNLTNVNDKGIIYSRDCLNAYLQQRFIQFEQNIASALNSLTENNQLKVFELDDIINKYIDVNSWDIEYHQHLQPLFNSLCILEYSTRTHHNSTPYYSSTTTTTAVIKDWLILGISLRQLKGLLHVLISNWMCFVSLYNNVNNFVSNLELIDSAKQVYHLEYSSTLKDIHQSPIESIYQTLESELKRQQASVSSLLLLDTNNNDDDHGCRDENQVNAVMDSIHDVDVNTENLSDNNVLTDITMLSDYQLHCTICHKNPFKQKLFYSNAVLNQLMKRLKDSLLKHNHNVLIYKQYENCLNNLMHRIQCISMWAIQFKQEVVIQCSMEEIHLNQELLINQLNKVEALLKSTHEEYESMMSHHIENEPPLRWHNNQFLQLEFLNVLLNYLKVYIKQICQENKQLDDEEGNIFMLIMTNIKNLIEQIKRFKTVMTKDHESWKYSNIVQYEFNRNQVQLQFKHIICVYNQLVEFCECNWYKKKNIHIGNKEKISILRQLQHLFTSLKQMQECIQHDYVNGLDENIKPVEAGNPYKATRNSCQEELASNKNMDLAIPKIDVKHVAPPPLTQLKTQPPIQQKRSSSLKRLQQLNKEAVLHDNVDGDGDDDGRDDLDKRCIKETHNLFYGTPNDLCSDSTSSKSKTQFSRKVNKIQKSVGDSSLNADDMSSLSNGIIENNSTKCTAEKYSTHSTTSTRTNTTASNTTAMSTIQLNSDIYHLISQIKVSYMKAERHLNELINCSSNAKQKEDVVDEKKKNTAIHDDGDHDDASAAAAADDEDCEDDDEKLTYLATSCDQLKQFLGHLKAYHFRVNSMKSILLTRADPNYNYNYNNHNHDAGDRRVGGGNGGAGAGDILHQLDDIWQKTIISTKHWIRKLQYNFVYGKSLKYLINDFERHLEYAQGRLRHLTSRNDVFWNKSCVNDEEEGRSVRGKLSLTTLSTRGSLSSLSTSLFPSASSSLPPLTSISSTSSLSPSSCIRLLRTIKLRLTNWLGYTTLLLIPMESDDTTGSFVELFKTSINSLDDDDDWNIQDNNTTTTILKIDLINLQERFSSLLETNERLLTEYILAYNSMIRNNRRLKAIDHHQPTDELYSSMTSLNNTTTLKSCTNSLDCSTGSLHHYDDLDNNRNKKTTLKMVKKQEEEKEKEKNDIQNESYNDAKDDSAIKSTSCLSLIDSTYSQSTVDSSLHYPCLQESNLSNGSDTDDNIEDLCLSNY
ncbi:unnamed protein product [Trichobilharzia szidati]|nr:unnamed protein product [Trichobilharzia szidati]